MARRPRNSDAEAPGQDSFLDIVANLVGILIILVMVVGARAKDALVHGLPEEKAPQPVDVDTPRAGRVRAQAVGSQVTCIHCPAVGCEEFACLAVSSAMLCKPVNDDNNPAGFRSGPRLPEQIKPVTGGDMTTVMMDRPAV